MNKKNVITAFLVILAIPSVAAETAGIITETGFQPWQVLVTATLFLLVVLMFLVRLYHSIHHSIYGASQPVAVVKTRSIGQMMQETIPIEREHEIMTDHEYDGIRELDNNLPLWWRYMFYATILFSIVYMIRFHMADGPSQLDEYEAELVAALEEKEKKKETGEVADIDENSVVLSDAAGIATGKTIFNANCVACHGGAGEGGVGPNLTDEYWIHGGSLSDVFKSIKYGIPEKGMIPWQTVLNPVQIQHLTSYIHSIKGTDPPNAKEAQGELYKVEAVTDTIQSAGIGTQ